MRVMYTALLSVMLIGCSGGRSSSSPQAETDSYRLPPEAIGTFKGTIVDFARESPFEKKTCVVYRVLVLIDSPGYWKGRYVAGVGGTSSGFSIGQKVKATWEDDKFPPTISSY